jgi:hypothetical protein
MNDLEWEVWARDDAAWFGERMVREAAFSDRAAAETWARRILDEQGDSFSATYAQVRGPDGFRRFFRLTYDEGLNAFTTTTGTIGR